MRCTFGNCWLQYRGRRIWRSRKAAIVKRLSLPFRCDKLSLIINHWLGIPELDVRWSTIDSNAPNASTIIDNASNADYWLQCHHYRLECHLSGSPCGKPGQLQVFSSRQHPCQSSGNRSISYHMKLHSCGSWRQDHATLGNDRLPRAATRFSLIASNAHLPLSSPVSYPYLIWYPYCPSHSGLNSTNAMLRDIT